MADTKVASAKRSTSSEALVLDVVSLDTVAGASIRSPIKLSPKRSTCLKLVDADSVGENTKFKKKSIKIHQTRRYHNYICHINFRE